VGGQGEETTGFLGLEKIPRAWVMVKRHSTEGYRGGGLKKVEIKGFKGRQEKPVGGVPQRQAGWAARKVISEFVYIGKEERDGASNWIRPARGFQGVCKKECVKRGMLIMASRCPNRFSRQQPTN